MNVSSCVQLFNFPQHVLSRFHRSLCTRLCTRIIPYRFCRYIENDVIYDLLVKYLDFVPSNFIGIFAIRAVLCGGSTPPVDGAVHQDDSDDVIVFSSLVTSWIIVRSKYPAF